MQDNSAHNLFSLFCSIAIIFVTYTYYVYVCIILIIFKLSDVDFWSRSFLKSSIVLNTQARVSGYGRLVLLHHRQSSCGGGSSSQSFSWVWSPAQNFLVHQSYNMSCLVPFIRCGSSYNTSNRDFFSVYIGTFNFIHHLSPINASKVNWLNSFYLI